MFDLKITGIAESVYYRDGGWPTKMIGLVDPGVNPVPADYYHIEQFHDVDGHHPALATQEQIIYPTKEIIENVLAFSKNFTDQDKVLIHCHAGVSRSTAVSVAVMLQHGVPLDEVMTKLEELRDAAWPNTLMIQYIDEIFQLEGALIDTVRNWKVSKHEKFYIPGSHAAGGNSQAMKDILDKLSAILED